MPKKPKNPKPVFPESREEFAGEIAPGPVSRNHNDRFFKDVAKQPEIPAEDSGEK